MRRRSSALFLGLLLASAGLAQPPADAERYPPAPELPGVVVGQVRGERPVVTADPLAVRRVSVKVAEPAPLAEKSTPPAAYPPTVTTTTAPVPEAAVASKEAAPCPPAKSKCSIHTCGGGIIEWLTFKSRARQSGCNIPPYMPPLQAWFPCDPHGHCGTSAAGGTKTCCSAPATGPVVIPPSSPAGTIEVPGKPGAKVDEQPEMQKVDVGLSFTPGAAPLAKPTTQTDRVSTWRPK